MDRGAAFRRQHGRRTGTCRSTTSGAKCGSGRWSANPTGRLGSTVPCPRRARPSDCAVMPIGGGSRGNVGRGTIRTLKSSIPYVSAVENRAPAVAGVEAETIEQAKERGPIFLRTRSRAVTAEDFEQLTREAAPEVARVRCVAAGSDADAGASAGARCAGRSHGARHHQVRRPRTIGRSAAPDCRAARPRASHRYAGGYRAARLPGGDRRGHAAVKTQSQRRPASGTRPWSGWAVFQSDHAVARSGDGWPWGRPVQAGDAFGVLQAVPGVDWSRKFCCSAPIWRRVSGGSRPSG